MSLLAESPAVTTASWDNRLGPEFPELWMFRPDAKNRLLAAVRVGDLDVRRLHADLDKCLDDLPFEPSKSQREKMEQRREELRVLIGEATSALVAHDPRDASKVTVASGQQSHDRGQVSASTSTQQSSAPGVSASEPSSPKRKRKKKPSDTERDIQAVRKQFTRYYSATAIVPDDVPLELLTPEHYVASRFTGLRLQDVRQLCRSVAKALDRRAVLEKVATQIANTPDEFGFTNERVGYIESLIPLMADPGIGELKTVRENADQELRKHLRALGMEFFGKYIPDRQCEIMGKVLLWRDEVGVEQVRDLLFPPVPVDHPDFVQLDKTRSALGARASTVLRSARYPQQPTKPDPNLGINRTL